MKPFGELLKRFNRGYTDVVGLDLGASGAKAVRIRKNNQTYTVVAVDILPPATLPTADAAPQEQVRPLQISKGLHAKHVALCTAGQGAIVKLLSVPAAHADKSNDLEVNELMGLGEAANYRVAYEPVSDRQAKGEVRVLAVAMPEAQARLLPLLFPTGTPAPCAIEVSGLSALTSFSRGPGREHADDCVAVVDFGSATITAAIFNRGALALIRKFDFGTGAILRRVQDNLGVDAETAQGILVDHSFDVSQVVRQSMEAFTQQLVISRDFVERRDNCRLQKVYVCGGLLNLRDWFAEARGTLGLETEAWNPFDGLTLAADALPDRLKGQESRFASATGAALAQMERD
jgi:Tfp pilus assembly PilM family ATPase